MHSQTTDCGSNCFTNPELKDLFLADEPQNSAKQCKTAHNIFCAVQKTGKNRQQEASMPQL